MTWHCWLTLGGFACHQKASFGRTELALLAGITIYQYTLYNAPTAVLNDIIY